MKNVSNESFRQNQNTFYVDLFSLENRFVDEIMWKSMVERGRTQMGILSH
jgi:hypothetical protein